MPKSTSKPLRLFIFWFWLMIACFCRCALADQIKLKNGDMLTGQIVKKEATTVLFKTDYAGVINVLWEEEDFYQATDDSYPGVRWAIKYDQMLFENTKFFHEHEMLVDIQKTDHWLLSSKTGLRFPPIFNFNATAQLNFNWDSIPAPGRKKEDSMLLFTLGYGW